MQTNIKKNNDLGTPSIPVLDQDMRSLMPCHPARARKLLSNGRASAYWNKLGIFCVILHRYKEPSNQPLVLGIDPGSKFEGWSVVGTKYTVLNGMREAPTWQRTMSRLEKRCDMQGGSGIALDASAVPIIGAKTVRLLPPSPGGWPSST